MVIYIQKNVKAKQGLQNGARQACEAVKFQVFQTDFAQNLNSGSCKRGRMVTIHWEMASALHLF